MALIPDSFDPTDSNGIDFGNAKTAPHYGLWLWVINSMDSTAWMDKAEMFLPAYFLVATQISSAMNLQPVVMVMWAILPSVEFVIV